MQLYEKVITGKRTSYKPFTPPQILVDDVDQSEMITLLTSLTISTLMTVEKQFPHHARLPREIKNVEGAIVRLAKLNASPLDDYLVKVGVTAWNDAIKSIQSSLSGVST